MDDLRRRLRRLGVTTGRDFKPKVRSQPGADIDKLTDGRTIAVDDSSCFVIEKSYPLDFQHGSHTLSAWLSQLPQSLAAIGGDDQISYIDVDRYVFLDTETTGLGGGAIAFQVGIGYFNNTGEFAVRQFFLKDPADEPAMLRLLSEHLAPGAGLVTFNGRTFDVPLLSGRYVMNRQRTLIEALPHLDLLHPARRIWRRRLASCSLSSLETHILDLGRTHEDVPGSLIPLLYRQYLQTKNARDMVRVLYHNEQDLLSMVTLGVVIARAFDRPDAPDHHIDDRLSLARWYHSQQRPEDAETAYRAAADQAPDAEARYDALHGLAYLLKRSERREEAVPLWKDIADLKFDTVGHEELAKHYEWQTGELGRALRWTEAAINLANSWRPGLRRTETLRAFNHRRQRLLNKLSGERDPTGDEN